MPRYRLLASQSLAAVALALALFNDSGAASYFDVPPRATGISALLLAMAAFLVAMRSGSVIVSVLLTAQGIADMSAAASAGSGIGVVFGAIPLVLGLCKAAITWKSDRKPVLPKERVATGRTSIAVAAIVLIAVAASGAYYLSVARSTPSSLTTSESSSGLPSVPVSIYDGASKSSDPPGYSPDSIVLVIGVNNTVTWTNNDSVHHTVTSTSAPAGASFNSGNIGPGATYTHTFTVPGTYHYDCEYHSWMTGTIVVEDAQ